MASRFRQLIIGLCITLLGSVALADESIVVASTTSTDQSGLFGFILPRFEAKTGIKVKVVALGTRPGARHRAARRRRRAGWYTTGRPRTNLSPTVLASSAAT